MYAFLGRSNQRFHLFHEDITGSYGWVKHDSHSIEHRFAINSKYVNIFCTILYIVAEIFQIFHWNHLKFQGVKYSQSSLCGRATKTVLTLHLVCITKLKRMTWLIYLSNCHRFDAAVWSLFSCEHSNMTYLSIEWK